MQTSSARTNAALPDHRATFPVFLDHLAAQDKTLPEYVTREFGDYLKCGRLEHGFLRVRCSQCHLLHCQGPLKIISCIDDPAAIQKILTHLHDNATALDAPTDPPPAPHHRQRDERPAPCDERMPQPRRRQGGARTRGETTDRRRAKHQCSARRAQYIEGSG